MSLGDRKAQMAVASWGLQEFSFDCDGKSFEKSTNMIFN